MSASNGNGRLLLDHKSPLKTNAQKHKEVADSIELLARTAATDQVTNIVEHYFAQIPDLVGKMVATMLAEAFAAHGIAMKPPTTPEGE